MVKQILELFLALSLSLIPLGATESAVPVKTELAETEVLSEQGDGVMLARMQNMLMKNNCFGEDFKSDESLVLSAQTALKNQISDGYISKSAVDAFVFNMYGVDTSETVLSFGECKDGCYPVLARGYGVYRHTVTDYEYNGDGTITVWSTVCINPDGESETASCKSVFFADGTSIFGYNLISCELY